MTRDLDPEAAALNYWNMRQSHDHLTRLIARQGERVKLGAPEDLKGLASLHGAVDDAMTVAIAGLRARRWTWEEIGTALGVTRQAANDRYGARVRALLAAR